jgi:rhodanese-related sulfurtransferase
MSTEPQRVSPAEAQALVTGEGYVHVDVRTEEEFAEGHPEGAYNVPFQLATASGREDNPEFLAVFRAIFPPDTRLVLGCRSGQRSLRAARVLLGAGYVTVVDQRAGWAGTRSPFGELTEAGWEAAGLPTATDAAPGHAYPELRARAPRT